jgi:predicted enzyme related to lactoylglutathione lyase
MSDIVYTHGEFCWHELATRDAGQAKAFYEGLVGWQGADTPRPGGGGTYVRVSAGDDEQGGIYQMEGPQFEGVPSHWAVYVWVEDVAATTAKARELGAQVLLEPMEVPEIGHMAIFKDPTGAPFAIYHGTGHPGASKAPPRHGTFCWTELATSDLAKAKEFYEALFGWKLVEQDMPMGKYTMIFVGEQSIGGMMDTTEWPGEVPSHWMSYLTVDDCDASAAKVTELGGTVCVPPTDIPPVGRFSVVNDPGGAVFSIIKLTNA